MDCLSLFSLTFEGASVREAPPLPGEGAKPRVGGVGHLDLAHINLATPWAAQLRSHNALPCSDYIFKNLSQNPEHQVPCQLHSLEPE